jgi:3-hydroxyacyl-[acyl-carrier-protein] dehydratase
MHIASAMQAVTRQITRPPRNLATPPLSGLRTRAGFRIELFESAKAKRDTGPRSNMLLDVNDIQKILPHRYPFLLIDGIEEMERWKRIVGIKNVTINESYFQGHFPGKPIMPGVLIIESMAQTGGLLLLQEVPDREKKLLYFVAIDNARFRRPVVPGDQLRLEMHVLAWRNGFCKLEGRATVQGEVAAEATLMCKMVDIDEVKPPAAVPAGKAQ